MNGIIHMLATDTPAGQVRTNVGICEDCEERDPALGGVPHTHYLGVHHGMTRLARCDHPLHRSIT